MFKISKLILTSILPAFLAFPFTTKAEEHPLVGINHPPLPEEVEEIGGWTVEDPYSIDQISIRGQESLLLSRRIGRDSQGKGSYKVVDVLPLALNSQTEIIRGGVLCTVNGVEEPNIVVIVALTNTPQFTKVLKAWRIENEKFNETSTQGLSIACENFGYGL